MLQIIFTIIYLVKRPKIKKLTAYMYPHVPPEQFNLWKSLEIRGIDMFLWGSFSTFVGAFVVGILQGLQAVSSSTSLILQIVLFVIFIGVWIVASGPGSKAEQLRRQLGIDIKNPGPVNFAAPGPSAWPPPPINQSSWPPPPASGVQCARCGTLLTVGAYNCASCGLQFDQPVPGNPPRF